MAAAGIMLIGAVKSSPGCSHISWRSHGYNLPWKHVVECLFFKSSFKDMFLGFRERKKGREKHPCEREISIRCLLYTPLPGIEPAT